MTPRLWSLAGRALLVCGIAAACSSPASVHAESPTINLANPPASLDVSPMPIGVTLAYPNLRIARPVVITGAGDGSGRLYIASQYGQIFWIDQQDTEVEEPHLLVDLSEQIRYRDNENEEGFLGLAFHPDFKNNGHFFVYYTSLARDPRRSVVSRFTASGPDKTTVDKSSELVIMTIDQPFWNHNGGTVVFGPDGYLYVGLGDGGSGGDPLKAGQDLGNWLGSVLRVDVNNASAAKPYAVPADNPFVGREGAKPEIYAYGIRNIWRMAFDPKTGDLWAGDVGQNLWEEVDLIVKGGNYGWSLREAGRAFESKDGGKGAAYGPEFIDPLVEYPHNDNWGASVTGGAVYRGPLVPSLDGYYLYGDYVSGRMWALKYDREQQKVTENRPIDWERLPIFTYGQTDDGEVLFSTMMAGGRIYRFVAK